MTARYLVRFDDICPTMNWRIWGRVEEILVRHDVSPLLAVVPDNRDSALNVGPAATDFWNRVRQWQACGWAIGLHGFQHLYVTEQAGIVPINRRSEFAGLPRDEQARKLARGLEVFRAQGVRAEAWVAPGHSFDDDTLAVLCEMGLTVVSDGFYLRANRDHRGITWIPQQLWGFRWRPFGLWTVCYHHNHWSEADVERFEASLLEYRDRMTSIREVISATSVGARNWKDTAAFGALVGWRRAKQWIFHRGAAGARIHD